MIDAGISLATTRTGTGAPLSTAALDGDGFVEQFDDVHVAPEVSFLDVPVDGALRLYAPQPGNGRE